MDAWHSARRGHVGSIQHYLLWRGRSPRCDGAVSVCVPCLMPMPLHGIHTLSSVDVRFVDYNNMHPNYACNNMHPNLVI